MEEVLMRQLLGKGENIVWDLVWFLVGGGYLIWLLLFGVKKAIVMGGCGIAYRMSGYNTLNYMKYYCTSSCYIWCLTYYFILYISLVEIGLVVRMGNETLAEKVAAYVEVPVSIVLLIVGFIYAYINVGRFKVQDKKLYIWKWKAPYKQIPLYELKDYAMKRPPVFMGKKVYFYYRDTYIVIPVTQCNGGYDFVNKLCSEMEIPLLKYRKVMENEKDEGLS